MPPDSSQIITKTLTVVAACRLELDRLQEVLAEFRWFNERSMQFLMAMSEMEEAAEPPRVE